MKKVLSAIVIFTALVLVAIPVNASELVAVNFEPLTYTLGSINGQDGWLKTGPYDVAVVNSPVLFPTFDQQSLRISNAITSGSFGDQTFAKPLTNAVGEVDSTDSTFSRGTLQSHFETQFDLATFLPTFQSGLAFSVSPDRGDGSRMSYLRFEDSTNGVNVFFVDVSGTTSPVSFDETQIATDLDRNLPHTIKLTMDMVDGASNDVVKVWIDGVLKVTGTSWENYYRYDTEASAEPTPRIVKTLILRTGGTAVPANSGNGFLFDNLSLSSSIPFELSVPSITSPANNSTVTSAALTMVDWTDSIGTFSPFTYQYEAFSDSAYSSLVYSSGWLVNSNIPTPGTPEGVYYLRVRAKDSNGNVSDWSNGAGDTYKITVDNTVPSVQPTNKDQCKKDGWMTFSNPTFKNQGDCVSFVQSSPKAKGNKK